MTKYKDLPEDEKGFVDYYQMRFIRVVSFSAFLAMGMWMLLSPEKPAHESVEKSSLYLFKELWGIPFGIILTLIGLIGVAYFVLQIVRLRKLAWVRIENGYYLFEEKKRISGLSSIATKEDMFVFYPEKQKVIALKKYYQTYYNTYTPAQETQEYSNEEIYWNAHDNGYCIIYKGKSLLNTTYTWRGDDLLVKSEEKFLTLLLKDYKQSKDRKIRKASIAN